MASIKDIPFAQFKNVADGFKVNEAARHSCVRISVVIEEGAPKDLVLALKGALVPKTATGLVNVSTLTTGDSLRINPDTNLALIVSGTTNQALGCARAFSQVGVASAIVVESSVEVAADNLPSNTALICAATPSALLVKLASWMVEASESDLALASNFDFIRSAVTSNCISTRSAQNAVIGALPFTSGADMPVMAANQFLMSLDIAGAYGQGATPERLAEGAAIVASSFASRAVARRFVDKLPGLGWAVRGAIGYGATFLIGKALSASHAVQDTWKKRA